MIIVARPYHSEGNDPKALRLAVHHHDPTFIDAYPPPPPPPRVSPYSPCTYSVLYS